MIKLLLISLFIFVSKDLSAQSLGNQSMNALLDEVQITDISTSGKSLVMDRGHLEKYSEGDYAKIYTQWGPVNSPKIFLVAEAELVKLFPKKSYWIIKKVHINNVLNSNERYLVMTDARVSVGRNSSITNEHVVFSGKDYDDADDFVEKNKNAVPKRLVKQEDGYGSRKQLIDEETPAELTKDSTVIVKTYEYYKSSPTVVAQTKYGESVPKKYYVGQKEVKLADVSREEDRLLLISMSKGHQEKVKQMKYGVNSFYRHANAIDISNTKMMDTVYETVKKEEREKDKINPIALAKIKRDGKEWSNDMDDVTLRNYFVETGMEKERLRRERVLSELDGHELMFYFSNGMSSHAASDDPNYQGVGYNLGIIYDYHLSRMKPDYKKWTIQAVFEKGLSNFSLGTMNAKGDETVYGGYLNYYIYNNPLTLYKLSAFVGMGIKAGESRVTSFGLSQDYSYQLMSLPSFQAMIKYRFRPGSFDQDTANVGMSVNLGANLDFKNLSQQDELNDDIDSKISYLDIKYTVGLSVFF